MTVCIIVKSSEEHVADMREQLNRISEMLSDDMTMDAIAGASEYLDEAEQWLRNANE